MLCTDSSHWSLSRSAHTPLGTNDCCCDDQQRCCLSVVMFVGGEWSAWVQGWAHVRGVM
jgi:hypothetical protein